MGKWIIKDTSESLFFDNSSNGFSAVNAQEGIEEAKATALGIPRFSLVLVMNGTMSNGDFITYSNLTPDSPIRIPVNAELSEVTWDNSKTSVDFDFVFYRNGRTTTPYATREVRNVDYGGYFNGLSDDFSAGDTLDIKYVDQGTNASDLIVVLFFKAKE